MQIPPDIHDAASQPSTRLSATGWGIAWMLVATGGFVSSDTIAKYLLDTYAIAQVVWARYAAHFAIVVLLLQRRLPLHARTQRLPLQLFRSALLILATVSFYAAISEIPLATASAIMFTAPIIVTMLSGPLLKEQVGLHRWTGVFLGFMGALAIVQPGGSNWHPAMIWAISASFMYALYQISTRALNRTDSSETTLVYTSLMGAVVMSFAVPFVWITPDTLPIVLMASTGVVSGLAHYAIIKAFAAAPASVVTPFGYTSLIWATCFGYVLFAELPDTSTFVGAFIIILSGIYILHRENRQKLRDYSSTDNSEKISCS